MQSSTKQMVDFYFSGGINESNGNNFFLELSQIDFG